ncbi:MAG: SrtB family sortase [Enterocloster asparagiformis]|nr:SrtB family sortase [Enterocloster asparagiformis]
MKILKRLKRSVCFLLALMLALSTLNVPSYAEESTLINPRNIIFKDKNLTIFGKTHHQMTYYQEGNTLGSQPTFCLQPGKKLPDNIHATYRKYSATIGETIPGVGSADKFVPITLAYEWIQHGPNLRDGTRYAVVQTYIWGCIAGYAEDWAAQRVAQQELAKILGPSVMSEFADLQDFVQAGLEEYTGAASTGLPAWNGTQQKMALDNGTYTLTLDISGYPQLKNTTWTFPNADWSYQIAGDSITFMYRGAEKPNGEIRTSDLTGMGEAKFYAYIFTPGANGEYQYQVGRFANEVVPTCVSFFVGGYVPQRKDVDFETFRHSETFDAHYSIDLEKYCAETNQRLEGTTFNVWEDFDKAQLSGRNYHEGSPDGRSGCLYDNAFEPLPSSMHICDTITTDSNGYAAHKDIRSYNYSKTYCTGHPAPEWVEVPEPEYDEETGECTNEGEIEAAEAENERLRELWTSQQEICAETCDFHVGNMDDDNHNYDYTAQEEMLADRDETYENFAALEYTYHLEEKTARVGYILHNRHSDDPEIETVTVSSAENGGNARSAASRTLKLEEEEECELPIAEEKLLKRLAFTVAAPDLEISDLREVEYVQTVAIEHRATASEADRTGRVASESEADRVWPVASPSEIDTGFFVDEEGWSEYEADEVVEGYYRYTWKGVEQPRMKSATGSGAEPVDSAETEELESQGPGVFMRMAAVLFDTAVPLAEPFPDFMDDDLDVIGSDGYGDSTNILYTFKVWDHRTEGEIHINKRDLELDKADPDNSYGQTQGDATLQGAVYGLFAAQDLIHPDGKTGIIYNQNDLVAVATTDQNGDASFWAYTEKPGTRLDSDGNILSPEGTTGAANLYNGSTLTSGDLGFGTISYPNYEGENGNQWIGRPLLMGNYYVMELSRSEGYELSVNGIKASETNRDTTGITTVKEAGQVTISSGLSDYNDMDADGSWNDFIVESYKTENGYDVVVTGYPAGTKFYRMTVESVTQTIQTITGSTLQPKKDEYGNTVYQTAKGGEYKIDSDGNPIIKEEADPSKPQAETVRYRFRMSGYPKGDVEPADINRWEEPVGDHEYLRDEVNGMLAKADYKALTDDDGAPWHNLELTGTTNADAGTEILDWFTVHNAWDSAAVQEIYEDGGRLYARLFYDYSKADDSYPAFYDAINQDLYIRKSMIVDGAAADTHYWVQYAKGDYTLGGTTATVALRREIPADVTVTFGEEFESLIEGVYQPSYETYSAGEILVGIDGQPIPILERVYNYADVEQTIDQEHQEAVAAVYDPTAGTYTIHIANETDWTGISTPEYTRFRAVTQEKTIEHEGETLYYNQYLVDKAGAGVSAYAAIPEFDAGSYIVSKALVYPGQLTVFQDGGTREKPLKVLQRVIKQSIRITKDISQASYDNVNTYGSIHNDPLTVLLGLFGGGQGTKLINQFKFKAYLKENLEAIYVDESGTILSTEIYNPDFKGDVQKVFVAPEPVAGRQLLEKKENGTYDYPKFFDAMYAADQLNSLEADFVTEQFAVKYFDVAAYKAAIVAADPELNSDIAYEQALKQAKSEAAAYLDIFVGLDEKLAIRWDSDKGGGADGDETTLQCNTKNGKDDYYNSSIMLPYGTYVIAEQVPAQLDKELANRHYERDYPKEIILPFAPDISEDQNTGETTVNSDVGNPFFFYSSADKPEDLIRKYKIRFNEETHMMQAHRDDGDFVIYKYGLEPDQEPETIRDKQVSRSENAGTMDGVVYNGNETASGELEIRDDVPTMTGVNTAIDGKYAALLVPWTILEPATDRINPDTGNVETLTPTGSGKDFNYVAYATEDFENKYYSSKLRIEKIDAETGENIIHSGALFKIYAAKREVEKNGTNAAVGTGKVLFGEAVDVNGQPVVDANGNKVLYPRVGKSNSSTDDLPIRLDKDGIPKYDESQLIRQRDIDGNETGIFEAYSTVREVVVDGTIRKEIVGYIETYQPLGAGAYVLVEVQAPEGYTKSRPVAFEIYADGANYYEDQRHMDGTTDGWQSVPALQYRYEVPVNGSTNKFQTETVSQIKVQDYPSRLEIYKVEDGDSMVGNRNGLQGTDEQGKTEASGGFDENLLVNDSGDALLYKVHGRKEYLEERGDVRDIAYDPQTKEWYGYVTKEFDVFSENIIDGKENELKAMGNVKLIYKLDGSYTGKGIRFDISISGAKLALYKGIEIEKTAEHTYKGITAIYEADQVVRIENTNTGFHKEIQIVGKDSGAAGLDVWDTVNVPNDPVNLYFYNLEQVKTRETEAGELVILDQRGNDICYADSVTGMAYVYDDYGRMIGYTVNDKGEKELVQSIQINRDGTTETLYPGKTTVDDENGLPVYYQSGVVKWKDECWTSDSSTGPDGTEESSGGKHEITRLPLGAYILQEEKVPHSQGYVQAMYLGLVLRDTEETQKIFLQNEFTKTAFGKIDVRTQREIQGAEMTLYSAKKDESGEPIRDKDGNYIKDTVFASWISGYEYDDDGNLKQDEKGNVIPTTEPHWIDHIPVGPYVLEETICPYEQGYTKTAAASIDVRETGHVQNFVMEDDFTSIDILKFDTKNQDVIYEESEAYLTLYPALLDENGVPKTEADGTPVYNSEDEIITFRAATWQDGVEVAATGRLVSDAAGNNPIMKYDYAYRPIPNTLQGRYYYTENGTTRFEYLPVGKYVLVEQENPIGYATATPQLVTIKDTGHLVEIQKYTMGDQPLRLEVSKVNITGGIEVGGAKLAIYPVLEDGTVSDTPLVIHRPTENGEYEDIIAHWVSGADGKYTEADKATGKIPQGFAVGDLKPHTIDYIPEGNYVLVEETTPYGFLQSVEVPFTIRDTLETQKIEMIDEIPDGVLQIIKSDTDNPEQKLAGAEFRLTNKTLSIDCETVATDDNGQAIFQPQPIGYLNKDGNFAPYTYVCTETKAAPDHMLTLAPWEFQFQYVDDQTPIISVKYNPTNDSNRIKVDKVIGDTQELLEGAALQIERLIHSADQGTVTWEIVDQWISTKQPHYSKGLKAGKYRLVETRTPGEGYKILAEPVEFDIQDGMTEIPYLVMRNYTIATDIEKTIGESNTLLPGAKLQLINSDGQIIDEWTTDNTAHRIYGLAAGTYIIHELEAPSGYKTAADKEIVVLEDGDDLQVFKFANYKKSSSGGGGGNTPKPVTEYISFRKINTAGGAVPGAEYTFYTQDGSVMGTSVSGPDGTFRIKKPADGTYTFRETKAPAGYALDPEVHSFTVSGANVIKGTYEVVDYPLQVTLKKLDGDTGAALQGAKLKVTDETGKQVFEGITGDDGTLDWQPARPGKYWVTELEAPVGYQLSQATYEILVGEDGKISGNVTIYNYKEVKKIGRITAVYGGGRTGEGIYRFGSRTPKTGDNTPLAQLIICVLICLIGFILSAIMIIKNKHNKPGGGAGNGPSPKRILGMLVVFIASLNLSQTSYAASAEITVTKSYTTSDPKRIPELEAFPEEKIVDGKVYHLQSVTQTELSEHPIMDEGMIHTVISEAFVDEAENHMPENHFIENGITYYLKSFEVVPAELEARTVPVTSTIQYPNMEAVEAVPPTAKVTVTDEVSGQQQEVIIPLQRYTFSNARWINGFEFTITVSDYDADAYLLGNITVPLQEEYPLAGYENELLDLVGVDRQAYRIDNIEWLGQAYEKDGRIYREMRATGQKEVADCTAVYGGEAALEAVQAQAIQAIYTYTKPKTNANGTVATEYEMQATATYVQQKSLWDNFIDFITNPITISIILVLLFVVLSLYIISRRKKRVTKQLMIEVLEDDEEES